jgi:hypothetical protein
MGSMTSRKVMKKNLHFKGIVIPEFGYCGTVHCGKNFRIFRDTADQTLPVTEFSDIYNWKITLSYLSRNIQLQVTFGLLHLGKSRSFRHSVRMDRL